MTEPNPTKEPQAAFAHETLHGVGLVGDLLVLSMASANTLRARYPLLERAIVSAESALADLYQIAGEVWQAEATRAEEENAP